MLTPSFELTQDDENLYVLIRAPYAQISQVDVHFDDETFWFSSKPYYLRLNLPGKVVFQENPSVKYDFDEKTFKVTVPKAETGEVFNGLDLITSLLAKKSKASAPLIEVIEGSNDQELGEVDWSIELSLPEDIKITGEQCGFGNSYSFDVFKLEEETAEIFEITLPQGKTLEVRRKEQREKESSKFDPDHYVADLFEDEDIRRLIQFSCSWDKDFEEMEDAQMDSFEEKIFFSETEKDLLRRLPRKEYILNADEHKIALLGLVDILFAYAYNRRTTEEENTVGSAWTINKISATLSWLDVFSSVEDVIISCLRRSLIYPLYRHFELSLVVLADVVKILRLGRKCVMKCLLEIHELFSASEPRYILNDLYLNDYNVWIQTKSCSSSALQSLAQAIEKALLTKGHVGLNLVDVECFAAVARMNQDALSNSPQRKQTASETNDHNSKEENDSGLSSLLERFSASLRRLDDDDSTDSDSDDSSSSDSSESSLTSDSSDSSLTSDSSDSFSSESDSSSKHL